MTFSAYNALGAVHVLDQLAEQHRTRMAQAGQQSDVEPVKLDHGPDGIVAKGPVFFGPRVRAVSPDFFAAYRAELAKAKKGKR